MLRLSLSKSLTKLMAASRPFIIIPNINNPIRQMHLLRPSSHFLGHTQTQNMFQNLQLMHSRRFGSSDMLTSDEEENEDGGMDDVDIFEDSDEDFVDDEIKEKWRGGSGGGSRDEDFAEFEDDDDDDDEDDDEVGEGPMEDEDLPKVYKNSRCM